MFKLVLVIWKYASILAYSQIAKKCKLQKNPRDIGKSTFYREIEANL